LLFVHAFVLDRSQIPTVSNCSNPFYFGAVGFILTVAKNSGSRLVFTRRWSSCWRRAALWLALVTGRLRLSASTECCACVGATINGTDERAQYRVRVDSARRAAHAIAVTTTGTGTGTQEHAGALPCRLYQCRSGNNTRGAGASGHFTRMTQERYVSRRQFQAPPLCRQLGTASVSSVVRQGKSVHSDSNPLTLRSAHVVPCSSFVSPCLVCAVWCGGHNASSPLLFVQRGDGRRGHGALASETPFGGGLRPSLDSVPRAVRGT
jgi:hypothetical protein